MIAVVEALHGLVIEPGRDRLGDDPLERHSEENEGDQGADQHGSRRAGNPPRQSEIHADDNTRDLNDLPPDLRPIAALEASKIGPRLPGGEVYTDDKAPVEWLIDKSILGYAGEE